MKGKVLEVMKRLMELGETMQDFCETTGIRRSVIYSWLGRGARLEDKKPVAKSFPTRVSEAKRAEVVVKYTENRGKMGASEIARHVGGICASKTAEIIRSIRPYILARNEQIKEAFRKNHYEFLKAHVCWSWDYMYVRVGWDWLKLHILMDEMSRYILTWRLTAGARLSMFTDMVDYAIDYYKVKPLVIKHDNDIALRGLEKYLSSHGIVDLPSPVGYPKFQSHLERGNRDLRKHFDFCEADPCMTYTGMCTKIGTTVSILRSVMKREIFDGKTCEEILKSSPPVTEVNPEELIARIKNREDGWKGMFAGEKGLKKMHRYAVIEELKALNLLKVEMEQWQEFAGNILYN